MLIAVDTMRAKNLSCYGYERKTSPNIDRLAGEGVLFEHSYSHFHNTHPAYTTLLTGMYAETHRVVRMNGNYYLEENKFKLLPQIISDAGYATVAVDNLATSGRFVHPRWMMTGFQTYINYSEQRWRQKTGGNPRRLESLNKVVFPVLDELKGKPFFMFVHSWDTHTPYLPREPFNEMWVTDDARGGNNLGGGKGSKTVQCAPAGRNRPHMEKPEERDVAYTIAQYDGTVSDVDNAVGQLMGKLDELGMGDDTLVILTSDHGENLAEHEMYFNHRWCYDDCAHVPIVFRWRNRLPAGKRCPAIAQLVDIPVTILDALGIEPCANMEGHSLMDVMAGKESETYEFARIHATFPDVRRAVRTKEYKFIKWLEGCPLEPDWPTEELYDMRNDPAELNNIINKEPGIARELEAELERWVEERLDATPRIFGVGRGDPLIEQAWQGHIIYR